MTETTTDAAPVDHAAPIERRRGYRPDIEGLRAVAVLSVVLYHVGVPHTGGGYVGVDVFFVISGFLITGQLLNDAAAGTGIRIRTFYARRVRRLLPAATFTIVLTLVGAALWQSPVLQPMVRDDARSAAFFFSNLRFISQARDYFHQGAAPSLFQHFWSLSVEEQFYVVWPTVMIVALSGPRGHRRRLFGVLGVIVVASFVACVRFTDTNQPFAFFSLFSRAWELGIGAGLAVGARRLTRLPGRYRNPACAAGLALIAYAVVAYANKTFPGYYALLPAVGSGLVIASGVGTMAGLGERVLGLRPFELIGRYSYSLYLFHFPVLGLAAIQHPTVAADWKKGLVVVVLGAVPLTLISYHFIEAPVRFNPRLRSTNAALAMGAACLLLTAVVLAVYLPLTDKPADAGRAASPTARVATDYVPSNLTPTLRQAVLRHLPAYPWACKNPGLCTYGSPKAPKTIVVWGDSHTDQWRGGFYGLARQTGWRVVTMSQAGCASFFLPREARFPHCPAFRQAALRHIRRLHPDLVVLSNHVLNAYVQARGQLAAGVIEVLAALPAGVPVAILGQTPRAPQVVPACLALHLHNPSPCEPKVPLTIVNAENTALAQLATVHGASFVDPVPWICSNSRCPAIIGNVLVYVDDDHISGPFAATRAPQLIDAFAPMVGG